MVLDGLQDSTVVNVLEELNTLSPRNAAENDTLDIYSVIISIKFILSIQALLHPKGAKHKTAAASPSCTQHPAEGSFQWRPLLLIAILNTLASVLVQMLLLY